MNKRNPYRSLKNAIAALELGDVIPCATSKERSKYHNVARRLMVKLTSTVTGLKRIV